MTKQNQPNACEWKGAIANRVREGIGDGVNLTVICDSIQNMGGAPKTVATMKKVYAQDIAEARLTLHSLIGKAVLDGVKGGNPALAIFAARSKAGWRVVDHTQEVDPAEVDENVDAISMLVTMLGKDTTDEVK